MKEILRDRRASSFPMTIGIVLSLIILMCGLVSISGFKLLRQVCGKPWRMLSSPQSMIIMQVCIMESGRDILAVMFLLEREVGRRSE